MEFAWNHLVYEENLMKDCAVYSAVYLELEETDMLSKPIHNNILYGRLKQTRQILQL